MNLGLVPYGEAWELQRSLAGAVSQGAIPDTILLLEHPPTITTGRRTEEGELHIPAGAEVEIVETDRGGKSTFHGPGQLVCYPIFDLKRHGQDVKRYCRDLEEALILTLAKLGLEGERIDGAHRGLADAAAAKDRLDRDSHRQVGDDPWRRAQRRPRSGPVHPVDHGLRARGRSLHHGRAGARPPVTVDELAARRSRRSPRSSSSSWRSSQPKRARPLGPAGPRPARRAG